MNGLIIQWIFCINENTLTKLPIDFSSKNYYAGAIPSKYTHIEGMGADLWIPTKENNYIKIGTSTTWQQKVSFDILCIGH